MPVRGSLSCYDYHSKLEENNTLVSLSEAHAITRENHDQRIVVTFNKAMEYLQKAYDLPGFPYKKYFAHILYKGYVNDYKETNPNLDIKKYKKELKQRLCKSFSALSPSEELKFKKFRHLKDLSLPFIALDKKRGRLFLILPYQLPPMPPIPDNSTSDGQWVHCLKNIPLFIFKRIFVSVNITERPALEDWSIVHEKLRVPFPFGDTFGEDEFSETPKILIEETTSEFKDSAITGVMLRESRLNQIHLSVKSPDNSLEFISDD